MALIHLKIPAQLYTRYTYFAHLQAMQPSRFICQVLTHALAEEQDYFRYKGGRGQLPNVLSPLTRVDIPNSTFDQYAQIAYRYRMQPNELILQVLNQYIVTLNNSTSQKTCQQTLCAEACHLSNPTPFQAAYLTANPCFSALPY
jgi:hypothetical protein